MTEAGTTTLPIEVRWGDMDAMGHVNNAAYFTYCESARIRYFEVVGLGTVDASSRYGPAVVTATCNFRAQVHYPASLEVAVRAVRLGTKSFELAYQIRRRDDSEETVADGSSVVVWVDYRAGRAAPVPADLADRIRTLDGLD